MRTLLAVARTQHISLIIYEACAVGVAGLLIGATYTVRQQFTCPDSERGRWKEWRVGNGDVFNQRSPRSTVHWSSCPLVRLACQAKTSGDHPFNEALITVFITKGDYQSKPTTPDTTAIRPSN